MRSAASRSTRYAARASSRIAPDHRYHSVVFTLDDLVDASGGQIIHGRPHGDERLSGGAFDTRLIRPVEAFFALRDQRDGHDFVADAFARGARAAVVERPVPGVPDDAVLIQVASPLRALRAVADRIRDRHAIPAIGITGNVGKTTTKEAVAAALGARYRVLKTAASFNNEIGVPLTFLSLEPSHEVAVIEMGFYVPGEIADLCTLVRPRVGIITRIPERPVHFSRTPSVEAIASGKAELIESLPADGIAFLNADDPRVRALAARGTARALGVPLDEAAVALATIEQPRHRMEIRRGEDITVIDDSYNASPAAVLAALAVLRGARGRRVAVIGDMLELGTMSADAHEEVGHEAAHSADVLVGVGELARTAVESAKRAGLRDTHVVTDGAEALMLLKRITRPGDVVLVKGSHSLALDRLADALVGPVTV